MSSRRAWILVFAALLGLAWPAARAQVEEPYIIEGESLEGASLSGTEITAPRITHGTLVITADNGRLNAARDVATLLGNVRIKDPTRMTTSREGIYRRTTRVLDLIGDVHGVGPEGTVDAGSMTWDRAAGRMVFREKPRMEDPSRVLWADRIDYDTIRRQATATGSVRVLMLPDSIWAYGARATYDDRTGESILTGSPRLAVPANRDEPAMEVLADTLVLDQTERTGVARGHVRIDRGALRTESEQARFLMRDNSILLSGRPRAWDSDGEIRADTMSVRMRRREADLLKAYGNIEVLYAPPEKPGERNVVLGDTLTARLSGGAVTDMEVQGSAMSLYLPSYADAATGSGRNLCRARLIHVYLARGGAQRVDLIREASGVYTYPGEATQDSVGRPAVIDSARVAEPSPLIAAFLASRSLNLSDSLGRPYDRLFTERVEYSGDTIRFHVPEERIRILGSGAIEYLGNDLKSEEIEYAADRHLITALGEPALSDVETTVQGSKMTYRTDEREGIVYQGRTEFDQGYYFGREIKKMATDELLVRDGDYTTCDQDSAPHYHFHAERMKILLKDKAVGRPVILYIRNIPVFALPYYIFPIRKGRTSGIMMPDVEFGFSRGRGRFARNLGYYYAINDYMDARTWVDYYETGPRIIWNGIYQYRVRYLLDGSFDGSYEKAKTNAGSENIRWSLLGGHSQRLGQGAQLTARADFTSDKTFRGDRDFGAGVDERLNRILKSSLEARKNWSRTSLTVSASRTENLDETSPTATKISLPAPSIGFNINSGAIGRAPDAQGRGGRLPALSTTYVGTSFAYRNVYLRRFNGTISANQALQQSMSLTDTRSFGPYLRLQPGLSANWAVFARDRRGERFRGGLAWSASVSAGNTVYGNFLFPLGALSGLRHVIEPSVSYNYRPELRQLSYRDTLGNLVPRFPNVGGIGLSSSRGSSMGLSLRQRFHAKWQRGEQVIKKDNLLTWSTSTSYDFLAERNAIEDRTRRFSTLSNSIDLRPFSTFQTSLRATHDPYTGAPTSFSSTNTVTLSSSLFAAQGRDSSEAEIEYGDFGESDLQGHDRGNRNLSRVAPSRQGSPWNLSLSQSYQSTRGNRDPTNTFNARLGLAPTRNWRFDGGVYLDLERRKLISHSFSLYRDLHCWELRFEHRASGARAEYYFRVAIKQIPDVQYQREGR